MPEQKSVALEAAAHASRCEHLADWCEEIASQAASQRRWDAARDWTRRQHVFRELAAHWSRVAANDDQEVKHG